MFLQFVFFFGRRLFAIADSNNRDFVQRYTFFTRQRVCYNLYDFYMFLLCVIFIYVKCGFNELFNVFFFFIYNVCVFFLPFTCCLYYYKLTTNIILLQIFSSISKKCNTIYLFILFQTNSFQNWKLCFFVCGGDGGRWNLINKLNRSNFNQSIDDATLFLTIWVL